MRKGRLKGGEGRQLGWGPGQVAAAGSPEHKVMGEREADRHLAGGEGAYKLYLNQREGTASEQANKPTAS